MAGVSTSPPNAPQAAMLASGQTMYSTLGVLLGAGAGTAG